MVAPLTTQKPLFAATTRKAISYPLVGRYWTIPGTNKDSVLEGWGLPVVLADGTQRYYRLPAEWIQDKNSLILFEEFEGDPSGVRLRGPE